MNRDLESAVRALPETTLCSADLYLALDMGPESTDKAGWTPLAGSAYRLVESPAAHALANSAVDRVRRSLTARTWT